MTVRQRTARAALVGWILALAVEALAATTPDRPQIEGGS
jgi:hypothetical protein